MQTFPARFSNVGVATSRESCHRERLSDSAIALATNRWLSAAKTTMAAIAATASRGENPDPASRNPIQTRSAAAAAHTISTTLKSPLTRILAVSQSQATAYQALFQSVDRHVEPSQSMLRHVEPSHSIIRQVDPSHIIPRHVDPLQTWSRQVEPSQAS